MEGHGETTTGRRGSGTDRAIPSGLRGHGTLLSRSRPREGLRRLRDRVWGKRRDRRGATSARPRGRSAGLARFGVVGASGIVVNEAAIALLVSGLGLHYVVGYLLATQCSTLWNFAFIETWAFRTASPKNRRWHRFVMLMVVNNIANVLTAPLYVAFTSGLGINYLVSNILTLAVVFVGRFAVAERIWGGRAAAVTAEPVNHDGVPDTGADAPQPHADAATPTERGADDELDELRARVAKLEAEKAQLACELADALARDADEGAPSGAIASSSRRRARRGQQAGNHRARSAKWFPTG